MGITITYGSYLSGKENIPKSCMIIGGLDTVIAVLAGIAIFPAVFAFGLEPGQGPGLIFGTLPMVFANISGGTFFAILFFALVFSQPLRVRSHFWKSVPPLRLIRWAGNASLRRL